MNLILTYLQHIMPGVLCGGILFFFLRKKHPLIHLGLFLTLFIFTRDAMTANRFWEIGREGGVWIRFIADPVVLTMLALSSIGFVVLMQKISPRLAEKNRWFEKKRIFGCIFGCNVGAAGALIVVLPLVIYQTLSVPVALRGGTVPLAVLPFTLLLALGGNLFEEVLFRGYIYGWLVDEEEVKPWKAGLLSGLLFSFGHIFLAYNVTTVGLPILLFALWEGAIAGLVRSRYGVVPATLTHGLAIFILTSGLF